MNIGRSIRIAAAMRDMRQKDFAAAAGVSTVTVTEIITGKRLCSQSVLEKLSAAAEMKCSEFIALGE